MARLRRGLGNRVAGRVRPEDYAAIEARKERRRRVWELTLAGASTSEIVRELGVTKRTVIRDRKLAFVEVDSEAAAEHRAKANARLDRGYMRAERLVSAYLRKAEGGDREAAAVVRSAIAEQRKIVAAQAKINGVVAPATKVKVENTTVDVHVTIDEALRVADENATPVDDALLDGVRPLLAN